MIAGVFQIRGRVHSLIDLARLFAEEGGSGDGSETLVTLFGSAAGDLGLRIDGIVGLRQVFADEIDDGLHGRGLSFVSHVTHDLVHIIDPEALAASPAVRIHPTADFGG